MTTITAEGRKIGQTTYRASVGIYRRDPEGDVERLEDGEWIRYRDDWTGREFPNLGLARSFVKRSVDHPDVDGDATIQRIEYVDGSFDDETYGHVVDGEGVVVAEQYPKWKEGRIIGWSDWQEISS